MTINQSLLECEGQGHGVCSLVLPLPPRRSVAHDVMDLVGPNNMTGQPP
jgi:hypothetical protein